MTENVASQQHDSSDKPVSIDDFDDTESDCLKLPLRRKYLEHTKANQLTFFGFAPLRKRLTGHALDFLLDHRRWAKPEDPPEVVGKKNVIMIFTIHAEIEDCFGVPYSQKFDNAKPLGLLQQLLGISYMKGPRAYTFVRAILKAFTNSRHEQILEHLVRDEWPPEPESPMDRVLLSVVDRRLVFKFTSVPLHTMPLLEPHWRLQQHLLKLERLLSSEIEVEKVFTEFTPMVPEEDQKEWPRPWQIKDWLWQQERRCHKKFNLPSNTLASNDTGLTPETVHALMEVKAGYTNAHTPDESARQPNVSEVSGGLHIYTLAIRLACNFISSDPEPEVVQNFANDIFKEIVDFATYFEACLLSRQPSSTGHFQITDLNDIAAVTIVISPVEIRDILEAGVCMVVSGLMSENPSLLQWSYIATEVQQGKVAFQNACQESLARRLPHGFSFFGIFE